MRITRPFELDRPFLPYFLVLSAVFVVTFVIGFFAPASAGRQLLEGFDTYVDQFRGMPGGAVFWYIFVHNVLASLVVLGAGLVFGIVPTVAVCFNGFLLGVIYRQGSQAYGYVGAALKVLPHGAFEIPAFLFAATYGLWLGVTVIRRIRKKEDQHIRFCIEHAFRRYFAVTFPLLVIAAGIETYLMLTAG